MNRTGLARLLCRFANDGGVLLLDGNAASVEFRAGTVDLAPEIHRHRFELLEFLATAGLSCALCERPLTDPPPAWLFGPDYLLLHVACLAELRCAAARRTSPDLTAAIRARLLQSVRPAAPPRG